MKSLALTLLAFLMAITIVAAQNNRPHIEPFACTIKIGAGVIAKCGYLVVPENRQQITGKQIKIPFLFIRKAGADSTKNISLFSTGGPGYSTIANFNEISANSGFLRYGGFIAFDQRGTKNSIPSLSCPEVAEAIRQAYRNNQLPEKQILAAVKAARQRLNKQGIDLSAYNSSESAADINDLRKALHIDSLTLVGLSYSGGLMLNVARNYPEGIKSLVLSSALPGFVNYEEHGLFNMNEALDQVFANCEADSTHNASYARLRERFQQYFSKITGQRFSIKYTEKANGRTFSTSYGKQELLDAIIGRMDNMSLKTVPFVIQEIINGKHEPYVTEVLDDHFKGDQNLALGMRYSVYCSEQIAYSDPFLINKQEEIMPWFKAYTFNNVSKPICDCWQVKAVDQTNKTPVYSNIPVLLSAGDADPWCRPFYNELIKRTMPNSQLLLIHNRAHQSGYTVDGVDYLSLFMQNPYQKLVSSSKNLSIE